MKDLFDEEEIDFDALKEANRGYIAEFEQWLKDSGLKPKTINNHLSNIDVFLNLYLANREGEPMEEGCFHLNGFFGFFTYKCMWSTPSTVKTTAASIKKFYKAMAELGHIPQDQYEYVCEEIKEGVPFWQEECGGYNSGANPVWW